MNNYVAMAATATVQLPRLRLKLPTAATAPTATAATTATQSRPTATGCKWL